MTIVKKNIDMQHIATAIGRSKPHTRKILGMVRETDQGVKS